MLGRLTGPAGLGRSCDRPPPVTALTAGHRDRGPKNLKGGAGDRPPAD